MRQLIALGRGLAHRAGSAVIILAVAIIAAAAAAEGPVYYAAAQRSIFTSTVSRALLIGRGYEATASGSIAATLPLLSRALRTELDADLGTATVRRVFMPPVESSEGIDEDAAIGVTVPLVWRTGFCAHLVIAGRCPDGTDQVLVSRSDAVRAGWHIGSEIAAQSGWPALLVTGIYQVPTGSLSSDYWVLHVPDYFPIEVIPHDTTSLDALFTTEATLTREPAAQGESDVDQWLAVRRLRLSDIRPLQNGLTAFANSLRLSAAQIVVQTTAPATLASVQSQWRAVAIPVAVTTATVLLLSWLLLYLIVTEAAEARGAEIALAKLRGHGRWSVLVFGLSEPVALLLAALPAGAAAGWASARWLATALLQPGTPVVLSWIAWAAAVAAVLGGVAAVILAAQRALRRGVVEQFRRPSRPADSRAWVLDSILLTGAVGGLAELFSAGQAGRGRDGALELLVPGLIGLGIAVLASRLLPIGCRALYGITARRGGLGLYLALRHIARRAGGIRTTIVLATAFSLVAFALAAWSVGERNYRVVAGTQVGAADVLTVAVPPGRDLSAIVAQADPSGRLATAVDTYISLSGSTGGQYMLAVDPARFARIADWSGQASRRVFAGLAAALHPRAAPPIVLAGDAVRVTVTVHSMSPAGAELYANVTTGSTPVVLGTLPEQGSATLTGSLAGCPCVLQSLALTSPAAQIEFGQSATLYSGSLTVTALDVHEHGRWVPAAPSAVLGTAADWRDATVGQPVSPRSDVTAGRQGLTWTISNVPASSDPTLAAAAVPTPLPAVIAAPLVPPGQAELAGTGLNGEPLNLRILAALPAVPGAPANGIIVDRRYAELAAGFNLLSAGHQVWLGAGALPVIRPKLLASGVRILSVRSISGVIAELNRQGPALATALYLADAAAAALLAAGTAILGVYVSAHRRRYEYAALAASGTSLRTLRAALRIELAFVLGFGVLVGTATGLVAARFVLSSVPEFTSVPAEPPLSYVPALGPLTGLLVAAVALPLIAAAVSSTTLIRGVKPELLRETPA